MLISLIFLITSSVFALAQDQSGYYAKEFEVEKAFKAALEKKDKESVAKLLSYPINIEHPLPSVKNAEEFIAHWDYFFDAKNIEAILSDKGSPVGYKGLMLLNGEVWIQSDKVNLHNLRTTEFAKKIAAARKEEWKGLNSSLHNYINLVVSCDIKNKHIRIQEHEDGFKYFVWKKGDTLLDKPELNLRGEVEHQGTMGGEVYTFNNKNYSYVFDAPRICEDECKNTLTILKDGKQISHEVCK